MTMSKSDHKSRVTEYFDNDAGRYEDLRYTDQYTNCHQYSYLARKRHVLSLLDGSGENLLDIGCGPGIYTRELLDKDYKVVGVDISSRMIEESREKFRSEIKDGRAAFIHGEVYDIDERDGFFDTVICIGVVSYISDIHGFLDKINSLIRPGGSLVIQISKRLSPKSLDENVIYPALKRVKGLVTGKKNEREWDFDLKRYGARRFNRLCSDHGLKLEKGVHFDYTLPLISIFAKRLNLNFAGYMERHGNRLIQALLAGDYVARYRKTG